MRHHWMVERDAPMKRGLKRFGAIIPFWSSVVERDAPMKRGLKQLQFNINSGQGQVERDAPMKRGLKPGSAESKRIREGR